MTGTRTCGTTGADQPHRLAARPLVGALCLLLACTAAFGADPEVSFPLGPWVRAGRPTVVRVPGATRVSGGDGPWALPQGERGDEFLLQLPRADVSLRDVEIDTGAGVVRRPVDVRALPADGILTAVFAAGPDRPGVIVVPVSGLPTVREAWLLFDAVSAPPPALPAAAARAIADRRDGVQRGRAFEPLLHPPGPLAFRAGAEAAARAGALPGDVVRLLVLLAVVGGVLLVLIRGRGPFPRAAWLASAPLACAAWLLAGEHLPGDLRVTVSDFTDAATGDRLTIVRFEARRDAAAVFRVPPEAGTPALLRYAPDDGTCDGVEIGREVRLTLPAGQSRILAWTTRGAAAPFAADAPGAPRVRPGLANWLAELGFVAVGRTDARPDMSGLVDARGFVPVAADSLTVATRK